MGSGVGLEAGRATCRRCGVTGREPAGSRQNRAAGSEVSGRVVAANAGAHARTSSCGRASHLPQPPHRTAGRRVVVGPLTSAQQDLVIRNIGLVGLHLRNRVPTPRRPMRQRERADLFQVGCVALVRAAGRYNPASDGPFAGYALPRIRGAIFTAVHEHFATIRVPCDVIARRRKELALNGRTSIPQPPIVHQWRGEANIAAAPKTPAEPQDASGPAIGGLARNRFERAVQAALNDLQSRKWRRQDVPAVMARIATERILSADRGHKMPIREISRLFGISSGRVSEYEQLLRDTTKHHLMRDSQLPLLLQFARQDPGGMDGPITPERREMLLLAEMRAFDVQLATMDRSQRAELLYQLMEESGTPPDEMICRLHYAAIEKSSTVTI